MKRQNTEHKEGKIHFVREQITWSRGMLLKMYAYQVKVHLLLFRICKFHVCVLMFLAPVDRSAKSTKYR